MRDNDASDLTGPEPVSVIRNHQIGLNVTDGLAQQAMFPDDPIQEQRGQDKDLKPGRKFSEVSDVQGL